MYGGENRQIKDGNYDQSLAVKCINGTFVGKRTESITAFRCIPYVGRQPVGNLRWKAPVDVTPEQSPDGKAKEWPLYDTKDKRVMVLDEFDIHPAKEADVRIVDWERTYFLTNYYMP